MKGECLYKKKLLVVFSQGSRILIANTKFTYTARYTTTGATLSVLLLYVIKISIFAYKYAIEDFTKVQNPS